MRNLKNMWSKYCNDKRIQFKLWTLNLANLLTINFLQISCESVTLCLLIVIVASVLIGWHVNAAVISSTVARKSGQWQFPLADLVFTVFRGVSLDVMIMLLDREMKRTEVLPARSTHWTCFVFTLICLANFRVVVPWETFFFITHPWRRICTPQVKVSLRKTIHLSMSC